MIETRILKYISLVDLGSVVPCKRVKGYIQGVFVCVCKITKWERVCGWRWIERKGWFSGGWLAGVGLAKI